MYLTVEIMYYHYIISSELLKVLHIPVCPALNTRGHQSSHFHETARSRGSLTAVVQNKKSFVSNSAACF